VNHKDEEILEAIWVVSESADPTIEAVQSRCPAELSDEDLSRLEDQGHLVHNGGELFLTQEGKHKARTLVRCHRLAESLLYTVFDLDWERREALACQAEHTLVPELADGICTLLGHPTECPDGKPIPPGVCCVTQRQMIGRQVLPLSELELGCNARLLFVKPKNRDRLHEISSVGLTPGVVVTLRQRSPSYRIRYDGTEMALDHQVAQDLFVCPISGDNHAASMPTLHGHHRRQGLFHRLLGSRRVSAHSGSILLGGASVRGTGRDGS
jgi:DtxR family Mn-dependent transcriptional regulator